MSHTCSKEKEIEKIQQALEKAADLKVIEEGRLTKIETKLDQVIEKIDNFIEISNERISKKANQAELDELKKEVRTKPIIVGIFTGIVSAIFGFLLASFLNK